MENKILIEELENLKRYFNGRNDPFSIKTIEGAINLISQFTPTAIDVKEIEEILNNVWVSQCEKFKHDVNSVVISRTMAFEMLKEALQSRVVNVNDENEVLKRFKSTESGGAGELTKRELILYGISVDVFKEQQRQIEELRSKLSIQSEKEMDGWISVEDRLPKIDDENEKYFHVLAVINSEVWVDVIYNKELHIFQHNSDTSLNQTSLKVTHWQPLPSPPTKNQ